MKSKRQLEAAVVRAAMKWYHCWTHQEDSYFDRNTEARSAALTKACALLKAARGRKRR